MKRTFWFSTTSATFQCSLQVFTKILHTLQYALSKRPLKQPNDGGLCRQVVLIQRCFTITRVTNELAYSGHFRQVVCVRGWSYGRFRCTLYKYIHTLCPCQPYVVLMPLGWWDCVIFKQEEALRVKEQTRIRAWEWSAIQNKRRSNTKRR